MLKVKNFVGYVEVVEERVVVHELDANHGGSWCRSLQDSATVPSWKTVLNLECRTHTESLAYGMRRPQKNLPACPHDRTWEGERNRIPLEDDPVWRNRAHRFAARGWDGTSL